MLRAYQQQLVDEVLDAFRGGAQTVVMQAGTGAGKTHTVASLIAYAASRGWRVLFLAHLDELVSDTHARLASAGVRAGFVQAGRASNPEHAVQVASLQTLHSRGERPPADLVILDECHRALGPTVYAILHAYRGALLLGLTATPQRGDGKALGAVYERLVLGPANAWLVEHGYLAPVDVLAPGKYLDGALADDPVRVYERSTPGQRAIVFAASALHAHRLALAFSAAGYAAGVLLGDTPREVRARLKQRLHDGELRVLVGVGVFVEGFDLPAIEVVVLARGFSVVGSYLQAIGRGRRPSPSTGKTVCTVLDLRGAVHVHGLPDEPRRWSLTGKACVRTDKTVALRRCTECLAIFTPRVACPRCGARHVALERVPRVLSRAEKIVRVSDMTQEQRDTRVMFQLRNVARNRLRMDHERAEHWARGSFEKRFGRAPTGGT